MISTATLSALATMLEARAGASVTTNANSAGYWRRIALASEVLSGAPGAGDGENNYMRRTALALETEAGGGPGIFNDTTAGYLTRIAVAGDALTGVSTTGQSIFARLLAFAVAPLGELFDFTTGVLPAGAAFTRASTGNRVNSSGVLVSEAIDVPRFSHNPVTLAPRGILLEEARTNLALRSVEIGNAVWSKTNIFTTTSDQANGPDGAASMEKIFEDTANSTHQVAQAYTAVSGRVDTFSKFFRAAERTFVALSHSQFGTPSYFNLTTGVVVSQASGHTASIEDWGGGLYRCVITITASSSGAASFRVLIASSGTVSSYIGLVTNGLLLGYAQIEAGASVSSYYGTVAAATTRAADALVLTISSGKTNAKFTFDDNSTQDVAVSPGAFAVPTNLARRWVKTVFVT